MLLEVKNLETTFFTKSGALKAVDGVSYAVDKGKTLGIVGESGCGKSVTSFSIMGLLDKPGRVTGGEVLFDGVDLTKLSEDEYRKIRGRRAAMIFQEPMTALNPVLTIGFQIQEQIQAHFKDAPKQARERSIELLKLVGIPAPQKRVDAYPHQLSGGMRQRAMIAMALSCDPDFLIADEPTTALDVTIQAQILDLLQGLQQRLGTAIQFITHDLGVISEIADEVVVMYAGKVVERAAAVDIFSNPLHPYTQGLLTSIPRLDETRERLRTIEGTVPSLLDLPKGCRFRNRCPLASAECAEAEPPLEQKAQGRLAACFKVNKQ